MNSIYGRLLVPVACLAMLAIGSPALAQGSGTASLSGVVDTGGGVIPGATVVVKNTPRRTLRRGVELVRRVHRSGARPAAPTP